MVTLVQERHAAPAPKIEYMTRRRESVKMMIERETVGCLKRAGNLVYAGASSGLYSSRDGGRTWLRRFDGSPIETIAIGTGALFAGGPGGLFRSENGDGWTRVLQTHVHAVIARESLVIAGTEWDGALRSEDGGRSWESGNPGLLDTTVLSLGIARRQFLAGTVSGIYLSRNDGKAWRMALTPFDETAVLCLDESLAGTDGYGLLATADNGLTWETAVPNIAVNAISGDLIASGTRVLTQDGAVIAEAEHEIAALLEVERGVLLAGLFDGGVVRLRTPE
jgi:photosystem II stability/assembly factor-like uncharacterized protein